jgi:hypothetical protein
LHDPRRHHDLNRLHARWYTLLRTLLLSHNTSRRRSLFDASRL